MRNAVTPEFSVNVEGPFSTVQIMGSTVIARCNPATLLSPSMSIWTLEKEHEHETLSSRLTQMINENGDIIARQPVQVAGVTGEYVQQKDRLIYEEDRIDVPWFRMRMLLNLKSGTNYISATAMCSAEDLHEVETAFHQTLASLHLFFNPSLEEDTRNLNNILQEQMLEQAMEGMERMEHLQRIHRELTPNQEYPDNMLALDVDERLRLALNHAGVDEKQHSFVRAIAQPTFALIESAPASSELLANTRVGGGPDLPEDVTWPRNTDGLHYNFLAQINLSEFPDQVAHMPSSGLLTFMSDTDLQDGKVYYWPSSSNWVHHAIPEDAECTAILVMRMLSWDTEEKRLVVQQKELDNLIAHTDPDGSISFQQFGEPVIALASEYEISWDAQALRIVPSLTVPEMSEVYDNCGIDNPRSVVTTIQEAMQLGQGPTHQFLGHHRSISRAATFAVQYAKKQKWDELTHLEDWFMLFAVHSGGKAGFQFGDCGEFVYLANVKDTRRGDFSRVFTYLELE